MDSANDATCRRILSWAIQSIPPCIVEAHPSGLEIFEISCGIWGGWSRILVTPAWLCAARIKPGRQVFSPAVDRKTNQRSRELLPPHPEMLAFPSFRLPSRGGSTHGMELGGKVW